jgi:hypothetical protein
MERREQELLNRQMKRFQPSPPRDAVMIVVLAGVLELKHFASHVLRNLIERLQFLSNRSAHGAARHRSWIEGDAPPWAQTMIAPLMSS